MDVDVSADEPSSESFPQVEKINIDTVPTKGISLFAQMRADKQIPERKPTPIKPIEFGTRSVVVQGSEAEQIHQQNINMLSGMSKEEVEQEREKILQSIDPSVLDFLKKMKAQKTAPVPAPVKPIPTPSRATPVIPELANRAQENKWLNFQEIEDEKLEWMKDVSVEVSIPKEGETYEARFDWKGTLLPFREEPTGEDNRELYLHGDEPHRPGYTLQELFRLGRSDVLQQRVSALTAIQGILAIYNQGFYDQVLELPISKIFFLLRFSLDDKAVTVVEQAVLGLANLFYNASDEFLLDCTFDTRLGREEPVFEDAKKRMKLEYSFKKMSVSNAYKTPVQDEDDMLNEDANLNDFHLAETDLLKCLLRTNIVERIQYLVNVLKPEKDSRIKESAVRILIRIARYGPEGIEKITENFHLIDGLIDSVMEEEAPRTTGLILKLLRLIIGYSYVPDLNVTVVMELAKKIIYNKDNLNVSIYIIECKDINSYLILVHSLSDSCHSPASGSNASSPSNSQGPPLPRLVQRFHLCHSIPLRVALQIPRHYRFPLSCRPPTCHRNDGTPLPPTLLLRPEYVHGDNGAVLQEVADHLHDMAE